MNLIASISGFLSNCLDLFPKYGQCRICSNRFCQFLICPDGHSQFRVQFVEHDRSHFVFICNHSQPLVFFPVFMPLYPTDGKKNEKHERTAYASPCVRVLVPAIGNFVPQQPCCVYRLVGTDCLPQFRYKALSDATICRVGCVRPPNPLPGTRGCHSIPSAMRLPNSLSNL